MSFIFISKFDFGMIIFVAAISNLIYVAIQLL